MEVVFTAATSAIKRFETLGDYLRCDARDRRSGPRGEFLASVGAGCPSAGSMGATRSVAVTDALDLVVEQRRPEGFDPTGCERRGDLGGKVEFRLRSAIVIVGPIALYHTIERKACDRIGL